MLCFEGLFDSFYYFDEGNITVMQVYSNDKIEQRALNTLESLIDKLPSVKYNFKSEDKELSWDGDILVFKDGKTFSKKTFEARLPVQIKGHNDPMSKFIKKKYIHFPVEINDLKAYSTEKGVLYFLIFMDDYDASVFYSSLYPSKISDYIEKATNKKNKSSINIIFNKLSKDPSDLYDILKQFDYESKIQGSAYSPIVRDRIKLSDIGRIKSLTFNSIGGNEPYKAVKGLATGDICLYGKFEDDKYDRPLQYSEDIVIVTEQIIYKQVSINNTIFYNQYKCVINSKDSTKLFLSSNLYMDISNGEIKFNPITSLDEAYNDARFMLELLEHKTLMIGTQQIYYKDPQISDIFKMKLKYIVDLYNALSMIGFDTSISLNNLTEEQQIELKQLVNIFLNSKNNELQEGMQKYIWKFNGNKIPILIIKNKDLVELVDAVYTEKYIVYLPSEVEGVKGYRLPLFIYQDVEVLGNLYKYDFDKLMLQIDLTDVNSETLLAINECILKLINVFDYCNYTQFLDMADQLLQRVLKYDKSEAFVLNDIQIRKRRNGKLDSSDRAILDKIKTEDEQILFGKNVLLDNKKEAQDLYDHFPEDMKQGYMDYPIYKLYMDLLNDK